MKIRTSVLTLLLASPLFAQTTTAKKPVTHPHATTTPALPKNIPPVAGIPHTAYSLKYIDIKVGTGDIAEPNKFYTVNYTGWLASDGTKFDSSFDHGQPITFPVGMHRVITGWDTGFASMHIGGKRRLFIPYQLAYGENGRGPIPPKADLIFDVELLAVSDTPSGAPTAPVAPTQPSQPQAPAQPASPPQPQN